MSESKHTLLADLSEPDEGVVRTLAALRGDLLLLGAAGKIGHALCLMAKRAFERAGSPYKPIAVSRFTAPGSRELFESDGLTTVVADLSDAPSIAALPDAPAVMYLAGKKFGTTAGNAAMTWVMNTCVPGLVAQRYRDSRIAYYSSGNVYAFTDTTGEGPTETGAVAPLGEYAQSVLGRERVFEYFSRHHATPVTCIRLNYANEPRYGVLVDIARKVIEDEPIDLTTDCINVVWQGDCNRVTLRSLDIAASPPAILNLAGPKVRVRHAAERFGTLLGKSPRFVGEPAGTALLSDGSYCWHVFGPPRIGVEEMIRSIVEWINAGRDTWRTSTHYQVRDGAF